MLEKVQYKKVPKHRVIEEELLTKIKAGIIPIGHQIPTENNLSANYGVSRVTVQKAVLNLASKGYVERTPGRGTFVTEWRGQQSQKDTSRKDIVALLIGAKTDGAFWMNFLHSANRAAQQFGRHVILEAVTDYELNGIQVPLAISEGTACGVLVGGFVRECYIRDLLKYKIPFLLVGNNETDAGQPSINYDFVGMTYQITSRLLELNRGPVWLVVEPFRLYCTRQIYSGYQSAIYDHPDALMLPNACQPYECGRVVDRMLAAQKERFSVIVFHEQAEAILASMRQKGINPDNVTLIVLGQRGSWCDYGNNNSMLCEWSGDETGNEAVRQIAAVCEGRGSLVSKTFKVVIEETNDNLKPLKFFWK
jgi:DNA-binding LacI/PurR family transcriptional regulator